MRMTVDVAPHAFSIREYRSEDEDVVLRLLRLVLGEGGAFARTLEFFRWKHVDNPWGPSQILLADGSELLGVRAFMRWGFRTPQGQARAVRAVDTATHPGFRRLGIFSRLTKASLGRAAADRVHLIFNTPNAASMAGYVKLGWQMVGHPRLMIRVLNPARLSLGLLSRRRRRLTEAEIGGFFRRPTQSVEDLLAKGDRLERILRLDDELCREGIRTERSLEFLRWRYVDAPSLRYFAFWEGRVPVTAALIFRPNIRRGLREIMLVEFLMGYGAAREVDVLMHGLARAVRADYMLAAATPGTEHWGLLRRAGFLPLPERAGPNFVVHPLNWPPAAPDPSRLQHWRLSLGDLELF